MKKVILALVAAFTVTPAIAGSGALQFFLNEYEKKREYSEGIQVGYVPNWVSAGKNKNGSEHYLDIDSVEIVNGYVHAWSKTNNLPSKVFDSPSARALGEYDCEEERLRFIIIDTFAGPHLTGSKGKSSTTRTSWDYPAVDTVNSTFIEAVCLLASEA